MERFRRHDKLILGSRELTLFFISGKFNFTATGRLQPRSDWGCASIYNQYHAGEACEGRSQKVAMHYRHSGSKKLSQAVNFSQEIH